MAKLTITIKDPSTLFAILFEDYDTIDFTSINFDKSTKTAIITGNRDHLEILHNHLVFDPITRELNIVNSSIAD